MSKGACEWDVDEWGQRDPNGCGALATEDVDDVSGDVWHMCAKHARDAREANRAIFFEVAAKSRVFA